MRFQYEIPDYVAGRLEAASRREIEAHLATCTECEDLVLACEQIAAATRVVGEAKDRSGLRAFLAWRPLAAGTVAGAAACLLLVATLGPLPVPGTAARSESARWLILDEPSRGEAATSRVLLDAEQPYLPLGVPVALPGNAGAEEPVRFSITRPDGGVAWEESRTAARVREDMETLGVVGLLVPASAIPPGEYRFRVARDGDPVLERAFGVAR